MESNFNSGLRLLARLGCPASLALGVSAGTLLLGGSSVGPLVLCLALSLLLSKNRRWVFLLFVSGCLAGVVRGDAQPAVSCGRPALMIVDVHQAWRAEERGVWAVGRSVALGRIGQRFLYQPSQVTIWLPPRVDVSALPLGRLRIKGTLACQRRTRNAPQNDFLRGTPRFRVKSRRLLTSISAPKAPISLPVGLMARLRQRAGFLDSELSQSKAPWLMSLAFGRRESLPSRFSLGLRRVGLGHLFALSGLHLGILLSVLFGLLRRWCPAYRELALLLVLPYLGLCLVSPSLLRAWLLCGFTALSLAQERPSLAGVGLAWTLAALLVVRPSWVQDLGFLLSFAACSGLLLGLWLVRFACDTEVAPSLSAESFSASLGAQLGGAPLALAAFHWATPAAILWNLLLIPSAGLVVVVGFLWGCLGLIDPERALALAPVLETVAIPLEIPASLPPGLLGGFAWSGSWIGGCGLTALGLLTLWGIGRGRTWILVGVLSPFWVLGSDAEPPQVSVHFLDVGQGDAVLLRSGERAALIDGGGWWSEGVAAKALLPALGELGIRSLSAAFVTHGDRDHCVGVLELARYVPIERVLMSPSAARSRCGRELSALPWSAFRPLWKGEKIFLGEWEFTVLAPLPGVRVDGNGSSLVLRAAALGRTLLLTGDIGESEEGVLLRSGTILEADILKVAHHGSRSSSSRAFLEGVSPRLSVVSVGQGNSFGHPASPVLDRLEAVSVGILRTDLGGRIDVSWSRNGPWRIETPFAGA